MNKSFFNLDDEYRLLQILDATGWRVICMSETDDGGYFIKHLAAWGLVEKNKPGTDGWHEQKMIGIAFFADEGMGLVPENQVWEYAPPGEEGDAILAEAKKELVKIYKEKQGG